MQRRRWCAAVDANIDLSKKTSLQRGAANFFNYCSGCHSLQYMRYNRIAEDLELDESLVKSNFMFVGDKIGNTVKVSMNQKMQKAGLVSSHLIYQ